MCMENYKVKKDIESCNATREEMTPGADGDRCCLSFKKVCMGDIPLLKEFFEKYPSRSCDYSIGGVLMWREYFNYEYAIKDSTLFLRGFDRDRGVELYYMPLGEMDSEQASELMMDASREDARTPLFLYPEESTFERYSEELRESGDYLDEWKEYLYDIEQFLHFSGKKMEKKRNHLNYFMNHYDGFSVEPVTSGVAKELIEFTKEFAEGHADSDMMNYESDRTIDVLREFDTYPFEGILVRYEGKVIGYTFGEKIGDTFFVHVEKGNILYRGVYQILSSKLAGYVNDRYPEVRYLNREEDMGNELLRKSKESYHPCMIVNKHQSGIPLFTLIEEAMMSMMAQSAS